MTGEEEKREKRRAQQQRYNQSDKGRARHRAYNTSSNGQQRNREYEKRNPNRRLRWSPVMLLRGRGGAKWDPPAEHQIGD